MLTFIAGLWGVVFTVGVIGYALFKVGLSGYTATPRHIV